MLSEQKTVHFYDLVLPYGLAAYDTMVAVLEDDSYWEMRDENFLRGMDKSYSCVGLLLLAHYRDWIASNWLKNNNDTGEAGKLISEACEYYFMLLWTIFNVKSGLSNNNFLENPLDLDKHKAREDKVPLIKILKYFDKSAVDCFRKALELL